MLAEQTELYFRCRKLRLFGLDFIRGQIEGHSIPASLLVFKVLRLVLGDLECLQKPRTPKNSYLVYTESQGHLP